MKRYALFAGSWYYPAGGWDDLIGIYDTIEEAAAVAAAKDDPAMSFWFHVVDLTSGKTVASGTHQGDLGLAFQRIEELQRRK
jgi:hypothetical protein